MFIKVNRKWYTDKSTIGIMAIDGVKACFTLEDCKRADGVKINGQTAIPAGEYPVILDYSNRFKKIMPHILNVPGFDGIRIHKGNTDADTEGCILVGMNKGVDEIYNCSTVFENLFGQIQKAIDNKEEVKILIINDSAL
jgi:hypothetical protein